MKTSHAQSIALLFCSWFALAPHAAVAAEIRTGERVHIPTDTVINEDLYAGAREVVIDGTVRGDLVTAGSRIVIHGRVDGSVMAAGGTVIVDGKVGRAVRLGGGEVRIDGEVGGDALAACGTCTVGSSSKVGIDLLTAGGELNLAGTVTRGLRAAGGKVRLAGTAQADAQVRAGTLLVDASATTPSLVYGAQEPAQISAGAHVGRVENRPEWAPAKPNRASGSLGGTLMALVTGAVLLFVLRAHGTRASQLLDRRFGASLLFGLLVAVVTPLIILIGLITVVGIPLSMLLIGVYFFALYFGYLSSAHFIGERLLSKLHRPTTPFLSFALGIALLGLVSLLPGLGALVGMLATLAGLGSLWLLLTSSQWFTARFRRAGSATASESAHA